jgi:hypothetical protein
VQYVIHPHLIAIMQENSFAWDDPNEDPYNHLNSLPSYVGLLNWDVILMMNWNLNYSANL